MECCRKRKRGALSTSGGSDRIVVAHGGDVCGDDRVGGHYGVAISMPGGASRVKSAVLYVRIRSQPARSAQRAWRAS